METRPAIRVTRETLRRLRLARTGRVHSTFARTVNIELDDLGDAGWLSLHGPGPLPAPFGIACRVAPTFAGLAGAPVRVDRDAVTLDEGLRIRLTEAVVRDAALPDAAPLPPMPGRSVAEGLLPAVTAVLRDAVPPADPLARLAAPALRRLRAATAAGDAAEGLAAGRALLGLGPGLTPAGDDCLVGWLAGLRVGGPSGRHLIAAVAPALLAAAAERTGGLSRAFLAASAAGEVAEPVLAFVATPDDHRLSALLAMGASSGADLLAGYLLARHALL